MNIIQDIIKNTIYQQEKAVNDFLEKKFKDYNISEVKCIIHDGFKHYYHGDKRIISISETPEFKIIEDKFDYKFEVYTKYY